MVTVRVWVSREGHTLNAFHSPFGLLGVKQLSAGYLDVAFEYPDGLLSWSSPLMSGSQ